MGIDVRTIDEPQLKALKRRSPNMANNCSI